MIIVDYADSNRSSSKDEKDTNQTIYEELQGISNLQLSNLDSMQINRSGLNAEVITMESISRHLTSNIADLSSLSRTVKDKNANGGRILLPSKRTRWINLPHLYGH